MYDVILLLAFVQVQFTKNNTFVFILSIWIKNVLLNTHYYTCYRLAGNMLVVKNIKHQTFGMKVCADGRLRFSACADHALTACTKTGAGKRVLYSVLYIHEYRGEYMSCMYIGSCCEIASAAIKFELV